MTKIFEFPNNDYQLEMIEDKTAPIADSVIHIILRCNYDRSFSKSIIVTPQEFELMIEWYNKTYKGELKTND